MSEHIDGSAPRRIFVDKQSPQAYRAMVKAAEAVSATATEAGLDRATVELINLRVSQLNGCAYCLDLHTRRALRAGESAQRLGVLPAWRETALFTPEERAALALAEATTDPTASAAQDAAHEAARRVLTEDQISAVIWVAITIGAFNRVSIMSGHPVEAPHRTSAEI
ncbi:carboxymuconolactone decarboxylase family protein [Streptomyces caniscabiei]|uniref:carboxymuconolactone decarboxylase family protein n=1 Tax=Streptomyces caniscabiei TaxID=2746961 RepID=UPI0029BAECDD|nr:carboxymuconolactone decarboxylase family protein [Streptomyces caniscabiei]MDX3727301.1 carboxymuconolactone decarboxylase family protein [Streptomyces caniscabiei]